MSSNHFIIGYLTALFGCYVLLFCYRRLSDNQFIITKNVRIKIFIFSLLMTINNLYNIPTYTVSVTILILLSFFYSVSKHKFHECLFLSNYICMISLMIEFVLSIIVFIFVPNLKLINSIYIFKAFFSIIYFWIIFFISDFYIIKYSYKKFLEIIEKRKEPVILIYGMLFIISNLYALYVVDYANFKIYTFSLLLILFLFIIIFCYIKEIYLNKILNLNNNNLTENQSLFNDILDDYRTIRHNLLNDFIFISSLCDFKTQEIINEKIQKYNIHSEMFHDFRKIPEGLHGILFFKSKEAKKFGVNFYIEGNCDLSKYNFDNNSYIHLFEIIGIVLDNAVEASIESKAKLIYFNIYDIDNEVFIEVFNTYNNEIDLDLFGEKNYSTKNRDRGIGIYYIRNLNKHISINNFLINDLFKTEIIVVKP